MSNRDNGKSRQTMQSVWMSHWMRTNCNDSPEKHNHLSNTPKNGDLLKNESEVIRPVKGFGEIGTRSFEIMNQSVLIGSESLGNEGLCISPFKGSDCLFGHEFERGIQIPSLRYSIPYGNEISPRGFHFLDEGNSKNPPQETSVQSLSDIVPYTFDKGKNSVSLLPNLDCARKRDNQSMPDNSAKFFNKESNTSILFDAPSTMQKCSKKLHYDYYTSVNQSIENDVFSATRVITKVNGNISRDLHGILPFPSQGKPGIKIQSLSGSTDNEGEGNVGDFKISKVTINNESSAETDALDMDFCKEKDPYSGGNSNPSNKAFNMDLNIQPQTDEISSSREITSQRPNTQLPDINLKLPALPDAEKSPENAGPGSSKTQSLDMDTFLEHSEQPKRKSENCPEANLNNRWLKRLKLSSSNSDQGTKRSNLGKNLSNKKMGKFFSKNRNSGKESKGFHSFKNLSKENEGFRVDSSKNGDKLLLSNSWIQRWMHNGSRITQKKSDKVVVCKPHSSILTFEELQKKQFPSIAAMALMGKAMNGFQKCEIRKKGCFTVWNTKTC